MYMRLFGLSIDVCINVVGSILNPKSWPNIDGLTSSNLPNLQLENTTPSALSNQPPKIVCLYFIGLFSFKDSIWFKKDCDKYSLLSK